MAASKVAIMLVNFLHSKFRSVNRLSISRPLKQLSRVSVGWRSQEYLFRKVLCFQHVLPNTFRRVPLKDKNYSDAFHILC